MWKRVLIASAFFASAITALFGGEVFAEEGNTATLKNVGAGSQICIYGAQEYDGSLLTADVSNDSFETQVVFGDDSINSGYYRCKELHLPIGTYSVRLNMPMGVYSFRHSSSREYDAVTFYSESSIGILRYLYSFGSSSTAVAGDEEEQPVDSFPKVFEIAGTCTFNKDSTITGDECVDANGVSYVGQDYINTGVALFDATNASKDFEVGFELVSWESSQSQQSTLFNAKLESSSRYYPGFAMRTLNNTNGAKMELTSRFGTSNSGEKKTAKFNSADIQNKVFKIVRINGKIRYSIDGGELIDLDDFTGFNNYFDQVAVFGASLTSDNAVQRKFNGVIKNMYIRLGTYEEEIDVPDGATAGVSSKSSTAGKVEKIEAGELIEHKEEVEDLTESNNITAVEPIDVPLEVDEPVIIMPVPEDEE